MPIEDTSIDWGATHTCRWRLMRVNPTTWLDSDEIGGVIDATVKRDASGKLLESGNVTIECQKGDEPEDGTWVRIELLAEQGGMFERHVVGTMRLKLSDSVARRGMCTFDYDCVSVLADADEEAVRAGSYAAFGMNVATVAVELLAECTVAPIETEGSSSLTKNVVFSDNSSHLDAAQMVLDEAGWCIQIDTYGRVWIRKKPSTASLVIENGNSNLLDTSVSISEGKRRYKRAWVPGVTVHDVIEGRLAGADLIGKMRVVSQSISTGNMATVDEDCEML